MQNEIMGPFIQKSLNNVKAAKAEYYIEIL